jgi:hypothetical protein
VKGSTLALPQGIRATSRPLVHVQDLNSLLSPIYEVYSKINPRLVGKKKCVVIAPKHKLSSNKQCLLSLNTYPHAFSLRSVGVIADETWTLSSPFPPAVRYVL